MTKKIADTMAASIRLKTTVMKDADLLAVINDVTSECINAYRNGKKVLFCGNGGSAADAQHLAAELSGRFYFDREPLFAEALHVNSSFLTATANDYDFGEIYARMLRGIGQEGDVLFAMSTSGNSENIVNAAETATKLGMTVVAMTGRTGGELKDSCDFLINIPSRDTPRIQEVHMLIGHIICEQIEQVIFG
ncbi:MAG: SIS domain-containing protein [Saprospiraceae bacterium]